MKSTQRVGKSFIAASICAAVVLGAIGLAPQRAEAKRPGGPLCGPTILWICTFPDGSQQPFGGTVCERSAYEQKTGATCTFY